VGRALTNVDLLFRNSIPVRTRRGASTPINSWRWKAVLFPNREFAKESGVCHCDNDPSLSTSRRLPLSEPFGFFLSIEILSRTGMRELFFWRHLSADLRARGETHFSWKDIGVHCPAG